MNFNRVVFACFAILISNSNIVDAGKRKTSINIEGVPKINPEDNLRHVDFLDFLTQDETNISDKEKFTIIEAKIVEINKSYDEWEINEDQRRRKIIDLVSEAFNIDFNKFFETNKIDQSSFFEVSNIKKYEDYWLLRNGNCIKVKNEENLLENENQSNFECFYCINQDDIRKEQFLYLKYFPWIKKLNISSNGLTDDVIIEIANNLTHLTHLNVSGNKIGDEGGIEILQKLQNLVFLDMSNNKIGDIGALEIIDNFYNIFNHLNALLLCGNNFDIINIRNIEENLINFKTRNNVGAYFSQTGLLSFSEESWKKIDNMTHVNKVMTAVVKGTLKIIKLDYRRS